MNSITDDDSDVNTQYLENDSLYCNLASSIKYVFGKYNNEEAFHIIIMLLIQSLMFNGGREFKSR